MGTQDNDQERRALYAQLIWPALPRAELSLGLRRAAVENDLRDRPLFGSGVPDDADLDDEATAAAVGLAVENGALRHLLRYTTHYRFPKVDEHTASAVVPDWLTGERGDPLRTQTGRSLELGVEYRARAAFARFMLYRLELDDQIVYDPGRFMNINLEAARHDGALFALQRRLGEDWRLDLDAAWLDARQSAGPNAGRKVPLAAPRSARLALTWTPDGATDVQLAGRWVDERPVGGDVDNSQPPLPAHTVFDLHLERRFGPVFAALTVRNLGDERYSEMAAETLLFDPITFAATETTGFYPAPARSLFLEIGTRWP
ncbi:MAG: hypothetical protein KatS3mg121_0918 [Gammaproteobacteria bacterium]|nr:MAG: hypothetical protein KatS3mg121_0918 [Gammaproteobacteria bacterium]